MELDMPQRLVYRELTLDPGMTKAEFEAKLQAYVDNRSNIVPTYNGNDCVIQMKNIFTPFNQVSSSHEPFSA